METSMPVLPPTADPDGPTLFGDTFHDELQIVTLRAPDAAAPDAATPPPAKPVVPVVPTVVYKRSGRVEAFDVRRIERAIALCYLDLGRLPQPPIHDLARTVVAQLADPQTRVGDQSEAVTVETIQDQVERALCDTAQDPEAATRYALYRQRHAQVRAQRPIPPTVRDAFDASADYFPSPLQQFVYFDKYSRFDDTQGRRETWPETVTRAVRHLQDLALSQAKPNPIYSTEWDVIRRAILSMDVIPSMRLLAMGGPAGHRQNLSLYNCSYQPVEDVRAFSEALLISMAGCGVGYSVERRYVERLPPVAPRADPPPAPVVHRVADSTEGWAAALHLGITTWLAGGDVTFDLADVRPAGSVLRTKGGRASGPEPLRQMLDGVRRVIQARAGQALRPLDAHDLMCLVGNAAVMGATRRTAMIALFDWDDTEMLHCKDGDLTGLEHRYNANNSAVWPEQGITRADLEAQFAAMHAAGRGEPGIFNRAAAERLKPARRASAAWGTNPCFTGETLVWTINGPRRFDSLVGETVPVLTQGDDGVLCFYPMRNIMQTRQRTPVYKVTLRSKRGRRGMSVVTSSFTATPDHLIFLADGSQRAVKDLVAGASLMSAYRFTANSKGYLKLRNTAGDEDMEHRIVARYDNHQEHPAYPEYHVHHKDGDKTNNTPENLEVLPHAEHNALNMWGASNPVVRMPERNHFVWDRYAASGMTGKQHSAETRAKMRVSHKARVNHTVVSVEYAGEQDVYDGTVDGFHRFYIVTEDGGGVLVHNCGEILLPPYSLCNLTACVARPTDTLADLARKVSIATVIGCVQSLATHFPGLRPEWAENARRERLLGVDITGQMDCPLLCDPDLRVVMPDEKRGAGLGTTATIGDQDRYLISPLAYLQYVALRTAALCSRRLGINMPAAVTCVKPSGNSSQLLDCASGLHPRHSRYYLRHVRVGAQTPMAQVLRAAGVPLAPENGQDPAHPTTVVAAFPVAAPPQARVRAETSALDQCRQWLYNKRDYTEHNPSVTITYRPEELPAVVDWVWEHRDEIGGMAFLPAFDAQYALMPYQEISEQEYRARAAVFPEVDYAKLWYYETRDETEAAQTLACVSGLCEL